MSSELDSVASAQLGVLESEHLLACVGRLPGELSELLQEHPGGAVVAGGFVRAVVSGEEVRDVDVFVGDLALANSLADAFLSQFTGPWTVHHSRRAVTVRLEKGSPIQFVHRWPFDSPEDLIGGFDLTVAKAALWWSGCSWRSVVDPRFYRDVLARRLCYVSPERDGEDGDDLLRILKFCARGYKVQLSSLAAVLARLVDRPNEAVQAGFLLEKLRRADDSSDTGDLAYTRD